LGELDSTVVYEQRRTSNEQLQLPADFDHLEFHLAAGGDDQSHLAYLLAQ
jgi:hypothetical protein